jgi:hypothetical protein
MESRLTETSQFNLLRKQWAMLLLPVRPSLKLRGSIICLFMFAQVRSCRASRLCRQPAKRLKDRFNWTFIQVLIAGELYLDAGDGFAYRKGEYLRQAIRCSLVDKTLYLDFAPREGRYQPWWHAMQVTIHGWQGRARVTQGNSPIKVENARTEQSLIFILPDQSKKSRVAIREVSK